MSQPLDLQQLSSCYRVLMISELVQLICDFSDKSWVNLLYVSRRTFACVAPIVWEDVDLKSVFLLIPEVEFVENKRRGESEYVFLFPRVFSLTRFKLYADFVRVARTRVPYSLRFQGEESSTALPQPLLSNLQRLVISTYGSPDVTTFEWVPNLLTPCLLGFEFQSIYLEESGGENAYPELSWIKQATYFKLIGHISRECPHLETLHIFPSDLDSSDTSVISGKYKGIASLKHLRTLVLGAPEIDQGLFLALAQLPCLEALSLRADSSQRDKTRIEPINIPEDSFLALRHLALYGLNEATVQRICAVSPLFRHLVKASFVFPERRLHKIADQLKFSLLIAQCLDHSSPHLVDLTVFSLGTGSCLALYPSVVMDVFRRIPLRRLRLDRARLRPWGDVNGLDTNNFGIDEEIHYIEIQWRDFLVTMPHLEELQLDLQILMSYHLSVIASTLPNLRLLVLMGVLLEDGEDSVGRAATQPITIRCLYYVEADNLTEWANASRVARYIYRIWPNAQFGIKESMSWMHSDQPLDETIKVIAKFNEELELLRSSGN